MAIQRKLDDISNNIDSSFIKYKESVDSESQSEEDKKKKKKYVNLIKTYLQYSIQLKKDMKRKIIKIEKGQKTCNNKYKFKLIGVLRCVNSSFI